MMNKQFENEIKSKFKGVQTIVETIQTPTFQLLNLSSFNFKTATKLIPISTSCHS